MKPYTITGDVVSLAVRLTPRARKDAVGGIGDSGDGRPALAIRLAAPPVEGAANAALIVFLAHVLGVQRSAVTIGSGDKSRLKIVRLQGVDAAAVERLLASPG
ncbi:DUF167 domain-containing protein [Allosphingosinicella deserti]|uniref:UPF0235 protein C7I55_14740 n=1 Tax=Allosphingosinicella deserti TaxID=2116704 RepID=A0A2P7QPF1_9SPHN|nr:DUF167 domain-containing protein [Sphingomonas deserti]PSJ39824.1 hypothetical protein C7I55_14740 [Sphingomonas deserti]